jgi:hypothetical protein
MRLLFSFLLIFSVASGAINDCVPATLARVTPFSREQWIAACNTTDAGTTIDDLAKGWAKLAGPKQLELVYAIDITDAPPVFKESAIYKFVVEVQSITKPNLEHVLTPRATYLWFGNYNRYGNSGFHCALVTYINNDKWLISNSQKQEDGSHFTEEFAGAEFFLHSFAIIKLPE